MSEQNFIRVIDGNLALEYKFGATMRLLRDGALIAELEPERFNDFTMPADDAPRFAALLNQLTAHGFDDGTSTIVDGNLVTFTAIDRELQLQITHKPDEHHIILSRSGKEFANLNRPIEVYYAVPTDEEPRWRELLRRAIKSSVTFCGGTVEAKWSRLLDQIRGT